ncbi:hypothetical protein [Flavihumibacter solisilvae]|uniref:Uncharacterized protein n=1 Tax=Flavihumibacter solisilvae TaxID=1349421 RepID=A0A0C1L8L6_9BACT|nr:hypothetical protein [Flavihumibacter solisilvae]KIC95931.1 hypothetical protein OI18_03345 [Flavihumibacter solisilvae]
MKIVSIFAEKLFSFCYTPEDKDELTRVLDLWNDPEYLHKFLIENIEDLQIDQDLPKILDQILIAVQETEDAIIRICEDPEKSLDQFFVPLRNYEYDPKVLSLRKRRAYCLRLYALRIDTNCFVITGGTIKLTHLMSDRNHTQRELVKLEQARSYLQSNGIFDADSFFEFLIEEGYDN